MATDFKYASQSDLEMYFSEYHNFDSKHQVFGWTTTGTSNFYKAYNTGLINVLFFDGIEGTAVTDDQDANYEFRYSSGNDSVEVYIDTGSPADMVMEAGQDNATYFDQMLVNASMELNSLLDKRFPMPLPKYAQFDLNTSYTSSGVEYDAIIIKSTCYIVASNLMRQTSRGEEADYYYNLVVNADGTGIVDRLNRGESKLAFEVDHQDSKGKVREITKGGTMSLIETGGAYSGEAFELFEIQCTTGGAYGTAEVSVKSYGSDKLLGTTTSNIKITGGLQHISGGWYARWQGASMSSGDKGEVELYSDGRKVDNTDFKSIQLSR